MKKRMITLLVTLCAAAVLATVLSVAVFADATPTYTFDDITGTLTISGTGTITQNDVKTAVGTGTLKSLVIEDGVTSIAQWAFFGYKNLTSVAVKGDVYTGEGAFSSCSALETAVFLGNVDYMDSRTFYSCNLKTLCFFGNVKDFDREAFIGLSSSGNYKIYSDKSNTKLYETFFANEISDMTCGATESDNVTWHLSADGTMTISGKGAMADYQTDQQPWKDFRSMIKKLVIKDGVTRIGNIAFFACEKLTDVTFPESIRSIGVSAFQNCGELTSVTFPGYITSIDQWAFYNLSSQGKLASVTFAAGVETIGEQAFRYNALTSITFSADVGTIKRGAFALCTELTNVTFSGKVGTIESQVFQKCNNLQTVTFSDNVGYIEVHVFEECAELESVTFIGKVEKIGTWAFHRAANLKYIYFFGKVQAIDPDAFYDINTTCEIYCYADNSVLQNAKRSDSENITVKPLSGNCGATANDNVTWHLSADGTMTIGGKGAMADYTVVSYGSTLNDNRPWKDLLSLIKKVVIEDGVTKVGNKAFSYCANLTSATISNSVNTIGKDAFYECTGLDRVAILGSVNTIDEEAFYACTVLNRVAILGNVGSIGDAAFYNCNNELNMYILGSIQSIGQQAFSRETGPISSSPLSNLKIYRCETSVEQAFQAAGYTTFTYSQSCFAITGGVWGRDYEYDLAGGVLTILTSTPLEIANMDASTATSHRIVVKKDISANITLAGVNIECSTASPFEIAANSKGNVTITLKDGTTNTLKATGNYAALQKEGSGDGIGTLTIQGGTQGTGTLLAEAYNGAGIGSNGDISTPADVANITIFGGKIAAISTGGAGIGGGNAGGDSCSVSNILITGGTVTAACTGKNGDSAGIGSGCAGGDSGAVSVRITGGAVQAESKYGAGIGNGLSYGNVYGNVSIVITGGSVSMTEPQYHSSTGQTVPSTTVTDGNGDTVTLYTFDNPDGKAVTIDGKNYPTAHVYYESGAWKTEKKVYLYLTGNEQRITVGGTAYLFVGSAPAPLSGTCGDGVTWTFDTATGTLTISGEGTVTDYSVTDAPWKMLTDNGMVKKLMIGADVTYTSLGNAIPVLLFKNGNSIYFKIPLLAGETATEPTVPQKLGYKFMGWYDGNNVKYDFSTPVTATTTLYARWMHIYTPNPTYAITVSDTQNGTVAVSHKVMSKGLTVTITATPDDGYLLKTLTTIDQNGNVLELTGAGDGKYTFQMPDGQVTVEAIFAYEKTVTDYFTDVPADSYYANAVLWASKNGITGGVEENQFGPDLNCTRAQLVTFLWRAAGCPTVNNAVCFTDVDENAYYGDAVRWATSRGIVKGYENGLFGSDDDITREQAVTILYRYAVAMGYDVSVGEDISILDYNDVSEVSEYAIDAFRWATGADIVQGYDGSLMPGASCTRAQIVTMLYRLLGA